LNHSTGTRVRTRCTTRVTQPSLVIPMLILCIKIESHNDCPTEIKMKLLVPLVLNFYS
jgi:hypothetical protein